MAKKMVSGIVLSLFLASTVTLLFSAQLVRASETIYIMADGSVNPSTAPIQRDGDVYTVTGNIYNPIVVKKDNIVIDGAGYTLQGTGNGMGIWLGQGDTESRINITVKNMEIKSFDAAIQLSGGPFYLYGNNITNAGIDSSYCGYASIYRNNIDHGTIHFHRAGRANIFDNNITNGGIFGHYFDSNSIYGNNIANGGIVIESSLNNRVFRNFITDVVGYGIGLCLTGGNSIFENKLTNNGYGIYLQQTESSNISANDILGNNYGLYVEDSWNNKVHHNNFVDNAWQVCIQTGGFPNYWDDGYPSGGNYWSDYTVRYPDAQELDYSGVWDTPYLIDENNRDNYPLVKPWIGIITATVDITPDTLNLKNKSRWVTAHIELSPPRCPADIDIHSIKLNDTIQAELYPTQIEDYDGDGILDLMVKFRLANLKPLLHVGMNRMTISGKVNGMSFEGVDTIKVNA